MAYHPVPPLFLKTWALFFLLALPFVGSLSRHWDGFFGICLIVVKDEPSKHFNTQLILSFSRLGTCGIDYPAFCLIHIVKALELFP